MGIVDRLKQEFDLEVSWLGFEIHPETPPEGMPLLTLFPRADPEAMAKRLNAMGSPFGMAFRKIVSISNSRLSLEAGEFARERGKFNEFHHAVFEEYFSHGRDIGDLGVLLDIGRSAGLDVNRLEQGLLNRTYRGALETVKNEAARLGVTAAPTFLFGDKDRIVGAQPLEVFRQRLKDR